MGCGLRWAEGSTSSVVFARWRQCAHVRGHIGTTWRIRLNLCFLWPTRVHNPNGKSIGLAVSAQLMAESQYTLQWATLSPKLPLLVGGSGPHLIHDSLCQSEPSQNGITIGSAVFAQATLYSVPIPVSYTHLRAHNANGITIGSAVLA